MYSYVQNCYTILFHFRTLCSIFLPKKLNSINIFKVIKPHLLTRKVTQLWIQMRLVVVSSRQKSQMLRLVMDRVITDFGYLSVVLTKIKIIFPNTDDFLQSSEPTIKMTYWPKNCKNTFVLIELPRTRKPNPNSSLLSQTSF